MRIVKAWTCQEVLVRVVICASRFTRAASQQFVHVLITWSLSAVAKQVRPEWRVGLESGSSCAESHQSLSTALWFATY